MNKIVKAQTHIESVGIKGVITGIWLHPTPEDCGNISNMDEMIYTDEVWEIDKDRCMFELKTQSGDYKMVYGFVSNLTDKN